MGQVLARPLMSDYHGYIPKEKGYKKLSEDGSFMTNTLRLRRSGQPLPRPMLSKWTEYIPKGKTRCSKTHFGKSFLPYDEDGIDKKINYDMNNGGVNIVRKLLLTKTLLTVDRRLIFEATIQKINKGSCTVPSVITTMQYVESEDRPVIYCNMEGISIATSWAYTYFGVSSNVAIVPSAPPQLLCCGCGENNCHSRTGAYVDNNTKPWIGPGSKVVAIMTELWNKIVERKEDIRTLEYLCNLHQSLSAGNEELRFFGRWTLGCHMIYKDTNQQDHHAVLTVAHALEKLKPGTSVTFLTEVRDINAVSERRVVVIGQSSKGFLSKQEALDILLIEISNPNALNLMQTKIKHPCTGEYVESNLLFGQNPNLGEIVAKRGGFSGNTVGKVITSGNLYVIVHVNGNVQSFAINAFAVSAYSPITVPPRRFAEPGDSGSLIIDYKNPEDDPYAFGMVWQRKPVKSEIAGEGVDPNAVICVKAEKCLRFFDDYFKTITRFQTFPLSIHVKRVDCMHGVSHGDRQSIDC